MSEFPFPVVIINDTRVDYHHGCTKVIETLLSIIKRLGGTVIGISLAHEDWKKQPGIIEAIERARLVIVNGEGTIHHDRPQGERLLDVAPYCQSRGVPAVLLNTTWHANSERLIEKARHFELISVRETKSQQELIKSGINSVVLPDFSMYLESNYKGKRKGVGFTDSVDRKTTIFLDQLRKRCRGAAIPIQYSQSSFPGFYNFFRCYIGRKDLVDPIFFSKMMSVRFLQFLHQVSTPAEYINRLSQLELLVSGRFHACTMAILAETPFLSATTNSHKIQALVEDVGLSLWRSTAIKCPSDIDEAQQSGWDAGELSLIRDYLSDGRVSTDALFKDIVGLL